MFKTIRKIFNDCFTGKDGTTVDLGRIVWFGGAVTFIVMAVYDLVSNHHFDPVSFGSGFGLVSAGSGASLMLKAKTEPDGTPGNN